MKSVVAALVAATVILLSHIASANPPVEAFGALPEISSPRLSPDGSRFAVIEAVKGRNAVVVYPVDEKSAVKPKLFNDTDWQIVDLRWVNNDRLLVTVKNQNGFFGDLRTWYRTLSISTKGGQSVLMLGTARTLILNPVAAYIAGVDDDGAHVYMPFSLQQMDRDDLYRVDVNTGLGERVEMGRPGGYDWILDDHGKTRGQIAMVGFPPSEHLDIKSDGSWTDVGSFNAAPDWSVINLGLSSDGSAFVYQARSKIGTWSLFELGLEAGAVPSELFSDQQFDVDDAIKDEWSGKVIGAVVIKDKPEAKYFDAPHQSLQSQLEAMFPGLSVRAVSFDADGQRTIVEVEGPRSPPTYYLFNSGTRRKTKIASAYPALTANDLGEMEPYPYRARDGLAIPAYLTLPPNRASGPLPLVVMPHGGPEARDFVTFDWWAQFLANRGYAVFQLNYRGSRGYGFAFTKAGYQQWGAKMQDDVSDGVAKLVADGIADPKRICIVGASFGGYAALAGAAFTPDLYRCAVSVAGLSNLKVFFIRNAPWGSKTEATWFFNQLGHRYADSDRLGATSPALHADQIRCPILLMHGKKDTTVPFEQSEFMRDALRKAGKRVEFVTFDSDDHYFTLADTRIKMLTELEKFLQANIGR